MSEVIESEYRDFRMMIIRSGPNEKFPFQFGVKKARLIVENFEAIKAFAEKTIEKGGAA